MPVLINNQPSNANNGEAPEERNENEENPSNPDRTANHTTKPAPEPVVSSKDEGQSLSFDLILWTNRWIY